MICPQCGLEFSRDMKYCTACGIPLADPAEQKEPAAQPRIGYSSLINDPAFARYRRNSIIWSFSFAAILAVAAIAGFYIYGETSAEMENPEALYIGLGIGGMFLVIALLQTIGRSRSKNWDGVVVDKKIEKKRRRERSGDNEHLVNYLLYTVVFRTDRGRSYEITAEDDDTQYNYYQIGDRVRHHKGLNTLEKYDKSGDSIIFCNACASLNDIQDDKCFRCGCPLLK
ncbi:MAG TPA: hypothetical protein VN370_10645 [Desulfitobacteriaceae bacterium]|nr:hypothetical protein [Desulfitobacteriaceae bacterium]